MRFQLIILIFSFFLPATTFCQDSTANANEPLVVSGPIDCVSGFADIYPCLNTTLLSVINLKDNGIPAKVGNDVWGWTDPETGREYVLMGLSSKTAIVDVSDPTHPVHLADLATHSHGILWRDIKVYQNHAFIVSEAMHHGIQVLDLTQLRYLNLNTAPHILTETAHYNGFGSSHNIAINEATGFAYAVGTDTCDSGAHVVDIRNPANPIFSTCIDRQIFEGDWNFRPDPETEISLESVLAAPDLSGGPGGAMHDDAYTHDIQCVVYHGPDVRYQGREICVASNDSTVNIVDVTDKANPVQISVISYSKHGFVHQGWLTEDHRYFLLGDEIDEIKYSFNTRTIIFDLANLETPQGPVFFEHETKAIDHNLYVRENYVYEANYTVGLRILNLDQIGEGILSETAYFDIFPSNDVTEFNGAWSVYPYFASRTLAISGMDGSLYLVRMNE